jgi:dihydroorotate dehydrogenase (NAD+) catalytic subunit
VELPLWPYGSLAVDALVRLVAAARAATPLPLIVKLAGAGADLPEQARAAADAGADALSLVDGLPAQASDGTAGTLVGPAIRPLALRALALVREAVALPLLAGGGVQDGADARALLDTGATAVALGSVLLGDMRAAARIATALEGL